MNDYTVEQIFHVSGGLMGIYAGVRTDDGRQWKDRSMVTDEAIGAVMDWSRHWTNGDGRKEYIRRLPDGRVERLVYTIRDNDDEYGRTQNKYDVCYESIKSGIYAGECDEDGTMWKGAPDDVTTKAIQAVISYMYAKSNDKGCLFKWNSGKHKGKLMLTIEDGDNDE